MGTKILYLSSTLGGKLRGKMMTYLFYLSSDSSGFQRNGSGDTEVFQSSCLNGKKIKQIQLVLSSIQVIK